MSRALAFALLAALAACSESHDVDPSRHNVLLLTVDTLRADHVGAEALTPFLDELLEAAATFEHAVTPVPRTTPALASFLTGAYPHTTGVRGLVDRLAPNVPTLAQLARDKGYRTVAVVSNHVLEPERGLDRGFETYDHGGDSRGAEATTAEALRHIESIDAAEPLFLWVHYIDPHVPYAPGERLARELDPGYVGRFATSFGSEEGSVGAHAYPEELGKVASVYRNELDDAVNAHVRRLYAGDVRRTDDAIGELMRGLREQRGETWTIVFSSDHGESLGEHDYFYDHGDYVYEATLHVPLAIALPSGDPLFGARRVASPVSLIDVAPTLAELCAFALPPVFEGRSLVPALRGTTLEARPVFAESGKCYFAEHVPTRVRFDVAGRFRAAIDGRWKLIWTPAPPGEERFELYDLESDPREEHDLYDPEHPRAIALREALFGWYRVGVEEAAEPTAAERRLLESLGYVDAAPVSEDSDD